MRKDIVLVSVEASAVEASKHMMEKNIGSLIVCEKSKPIGIVTERDLVLKVMAEEKDPTKVTVREIMSTPLVTIDLDATVEEAVKTMAEHGIRRLPVVRDDIIYGIFTARDLAKNFNQYEESVARDIIRHCVSLPF
jgi:CBS domain-containing protein